MQNKKMDMDLELHNLCVSIHYDVIDYLRSFFKFEYSVYV